MIWLPSFITGLWPPPYSGRSTLKSVSSSRHLFFTNPAQFFFNRNPVIIDLGVEFQANFPYHHHDPGDLREEVVSLNLLTIHTST